MSEAKPFSISKWEAAEIIGVTDRTMRRWRKQYEEHGYSGLWDTGSEVRVRNVCL